MPVPDQYRTRALAEHVFWRTGAVKPCRKLSEGIGWASHQKTETVSQIQNCRTETIERNVVSNSCRRVGWATFKHCPLRGTTTTPQNHARTSANKIGSDVNSGTPPSHPDIFGNVRLWRCLSMGHIFGKWLFRFCPGLCGRASLNFLKNGRLGRSFPVPPKRKFQCNVGFGVLFNNRSNNCSGDFGPTS